MEAALGGIVTGTVVGAAASGTLSAARTEAYLVANPWTRVAGGAAGGALTAVVRNVVNGADWSTADPWINVAESAVSGGASAGFQALRSRPGVADPQHQMWINDLVGIDEMELPAFNGPARLRIVR
jgi:hypothetical protein